MSPQALRLLNELRKRSQGCTETRKDGTTWREVYPTDITIPGITEAQKPGYLSALEREGFYEKSDRYFGMVRL
jgi:hypothetical protein